MGFHLKEGERLDDLEISGLKIIQSPDKFRFGIDAVLLSGFVHVKKKDRILDLGTGTGILPLLLYAKTPAGHLEGLEIQKKVRIWQEGAFLETEFRRGKERHVLSVSEKVTSKKGARFSAKKALISSPRIPLI